MRPKFAIGLIVILSVFAILMVFRAAPIAQDQAYHQFADSRAFIGIPNFGDVMGNAFFMLFGLMGVVAIARQKRSDSHLTKQEALLWKIFFFGTFLVGFGSGYYHLNPNNATLVWDRLPMTIAFMSFFSLVIMERIDAKAGFALFPFLLVMAMGSVFYWSYTESISAGDLRPYALVQFLPLLLIPLIFWLFPARYTAIKYLGFTLGWYMLAKLLEHFDSSIFTLLGGAVSGHTLKHIAAAMGVYSMVLYVKKRAKIES